MLSFHGFFCLETQCNLLVSPQNKILCDELHCKMMTPANWKQTTETEEMCLFCLLVNFNCNTNRQKLDFQAGQVLFYQRKSVDRETDTQTNKAQRESPLWYLWLSGWRLSAVCVWGKFSFKFSLHNLHFCLIWLVRSNTFPVFPYTEFYGTKWRTVLTFW